MKSFVVIGLGRFGEAMAVQLFNMGYEVLAIDKDSNKVNEIADKVTQAACGDTKSEAVLDTLGVKNFDYAIVAIGGDIADSVMTTLVLKEMGIKHILCKASDNNHKKLLQKIGADTVIIPEHEAGVKSAMSIVSNNVFDIIDLSDRYSIVDVRVPLRWVGKTISELNVRREFGINVVAIKNGQTGKVISISPKPEYKFCDTDIVVLVGETVVINSLTQ